MSTVKVYHNPHFLDYRGQHSEIVPPWRPIATVQMPAGTVVEQALEIAFRQTQHLDDVEGGWWNRPEVMLLVRSTSVGDLLEACTEGSRSDEQGNLFVVERQGFQPYRPQPIRAEQRLAEAYRLLDEALARGSADPIVAAAGQVRRLIGHLLAQA